MRLNIKWFLLIAVVIALTAVFPISQGECGVNNGYIANSDGTVSVIDIGTNTQVATIHLTTGFVPVAVAVSPIVNRAYVANDNGTVSVIDTPTNLEMTVIGLTASPTPVGIAVSPSGKKVYVANSGGTVSVIDATTNTEIIGSPVTLTGPPAPVGIAVSPSGSTVYVANSGGTVSVIDAGTNTETGFISLTNTPTPVGISASPAGDKVYVANSDGSVSVIDAASNTEVVGSPFVLTGPPAPVGIAVSPSGGKVYVANSGGSVSVIDAATNTEVVGSPITLTNTPTPVGVAVSPSGGKVYVANSGGSVSVIDAATNTEVAGSPFPLTGTPTPVAIALQPSTPPTPGDIGNITGRFNWYRGDGCYTIVVDASMNTTDPNTPPTYSWDFGDGGYAGFCVDTAITDEAACTSQIPPGVWTGSSCIDQFITTEAACTALPTGSWTNATQCNSDGSICTHSYMGAGTYAVKLTVSGLVSRTMMVSAAGSNQVPTATFNVAVDTTNDPTGMTLTATDASEAASCGAGTTSPAGTGIVLWGDGTVSIMGLPDLTLVRTFSHKYNVRGTYTLRYAFRDVNGNKSMAVPQTITVPSIAGGGLYTVSGSVTYAADYPWCVDFSVPADGDCLDNGIDVGPGLGVGNVAIYIKDGNTIVKMGKTKSDGTFTINNVPVNSTNTYDLVLTRNGFVFNGPTTVSSTTNSGLQFTASVQP